MSHDFSKEEEKNENKNLQEIEEKENLFTCNMNRENKNILSSCYCRQHNLTGFINVLT